jgi:phospholipid/cholesterol/gamma-HCH transport system substrate-binding protein
LRWTPELKVGVATSAALLVLMVSLLFIADVRWPGSGYRVTATFTFLGDLRENAPVKYAGGIQVGKVERIRCVDSKAAVDLLITNKDFRLRKDSYVVIYTSGLLGERYVAIGSNLGQGEFLKPGDVIEGTDPTNLDESLITFGRLMSTLNDVLGTKEAKQSINRSFKNAADTTEQLAQATRDARIRVTRILDDLAKSGKDVQSVTHSVQSLAKNIDELTRTLDKKNLNEAIVNLNQTLKSLNEVAKNVNAGQGAAGVLLKDEKVAKDLRELIEELKAHPWKLLWKK